MIQEKYFTIFFFSILSFNLLFSQETPEYTSFTSPIKHEIRLAGTFGELRSNHFHMGLDIKSSQGASGDPIYAAEKGFVSRIKVSRTGYGNAIYIDHPNGYTSVYGHLKSFNKEIADYVYRTQHELKSFEIDVDPDSLQIIIASGEQIAFMGNSGQSSGPHLHFEIRETISEVPINPMIFGIKPMDTTPPKLPSIKFYELNDKLEEVNGIKVNTKNLGNGQYRLTGDTIQVGAWRTAIGIQAFDPMNNGYNKNGIYKIKMKVDGALVYTVEFDSISFDNTRFLNAHIDYPNFRQTKIRYHRCYKLLGNRLPNIKQEEDAIIKLYKNKPRAVEVSVFDFQDNESKLKFYLLRNETISAAKPTIFNYILPYTEANAITQNNLNVYFPEQTFYEDTYLTLNVSSEISESQIASIFHIGNPDIPLHRYAKIFISDIKVAPMDTSKLCWVRCDSKNNITSYGGDWEKDHFTTRINQFGDYTLMLDTIAPTIKPNFTSDNFQKRSAISFTISDNFSVSGDAKGLHYNAYLDGEWVLFEYDLKKNRITHHFATPPDAREHNLLIEVLDDRGNKNIFQRNIKR